MNALREARLKAGLSQRELSERAHTCQSIVCALELERRKPWPKVAYRLSEVLRVPPERLFPGDWSRIVHTDES